MSTTNSNIDHPSHYNQPGQPECIDAMLHQFGACSLANFCILNAYKYLWRAGSKEGNSAEQDISKARWYIERRNAIVRDLSTPGHYTPLTVEKVASWVRQDKQTL